MIKHPDYWLEDGSVLIVVEDAIYRLYRSLITRISPQFFQDCCQIASIPENVLTGLGSLPCFAVRQEMRVSKEDFDVLIRYILHDNIPLDEAPFGHILRLYIVTSEAKCRFQKIHRVAEKQLGVYIKRNPLEIDFSDYGLLEDAIAVPNEADDHQLRSLLRRALYYSYVTHDDISFAGGNSPDANTKHITGSDAAICEQLMAQLSENFSPTLFQPPAVLHMQCTDVYAGLWMERAVQPAFADNGTANPFFTLRRLRSLDWKRDADGLDEERSQPCEECLKHMRQQWSDEAQSIWEMMDGWLEK